VLGISTTLKRLVVAAMFAICVGPTFISYRPYLFRWDDSDYPERSIAVSRAFWSENVHGVGAMVSIRPPAMTLLGLPWGPLTSWDAADLVLGRAAAVAAGFACFGLCAAGIPTGCCADRQSLSRSDAV
jgi:hypothetical protein